MEGTSMHRGHHLSSGADLLAFVVEVRALLVRILPPLIEQLDSPTAQITQECLEVTEERFHLLLTNLSDPEFRESQEDCVTELGLGGADLELSRLVFDHATQSGNVREALRISSNVLDGVSRLHRVGPSAVALNRFVRDLEQLVSTVGANPP
jgi:hypothetical protein